MAQVDSNLLDSLADLRDSLAPEQLAVVNKAIALIAKITSFLDGHLWDSETVQNIVLELRDAGIEIQDCDS